MNETDYHHLADKAFAHISDILTPADEKGLIDLEYQDGVMTIMLSSHKQYIINKHGVLKEIWLSSPVSGGWHFKYSGGEWVLADGRRLTHVLVEELRAAGIEVTG